MAKYIALDALYSALDFIEENAVKGEEQNVRCITKAMRDIKFIPADVAEVRHARWIWEGFNIECSECGFMPQFDSTEPLYNYCPNCGARMQPEVDADA